MRRPQGYVTICADTIIERDSAVCGHCNRIIEVKPGTASTVYLEHTLHIDPITRHASIQTTEHPGAFCRVCMSAVCLVCDADGRCTPLVKQIEQMEAKGRFLQAVLG